MQELPNFDELPLYKRVDWVNAVFLTLSPFVALIGTPLYIHHYGIHWNLIAFFVFYCVATSMSITGGYHRWFSHRAYEANNFVKYLFVFFGTGALEGSVLDWASSHRRHHKFVDTNEDPYSIKRGFFFAHMGCVYYKKHPKYRNVLVSDLMKDPLMLWQDKYIFPLSMLMCFIVPTLVGWAMGAPFGGFLIAGITRVVFTHHCTFFINSLCHTIGKKPYGGHDSARDSFIMALLTYGEGYHNFHHRFQYDYRNGVRWYHWDPTKWSIRVMAWLGLASKLRRVSTEELTRARELS
jgi:stearoyl-CoA desaturase (delta-9 desaturase)